MFTVPAVSHEEWNGHGIGFFHLDPELGEDEVGVETQERVDIGSDGHLQLFELFYLSFTSMPVGLVSLASIELKQWLSMTSLLFSLAMHIALPTVAAILLVQLSFAVISRAAPSMNLFAVGFPLTILLGFLFLYILLDEVFLVFLNYLNNQFESFSNLFFL